MPIYEYKCKKCGKKFELLQGISDPVATNCRFCTGPVQKLMSLSSFHLKGSGWYATDYSGKKAPASDSKTAESSSESNIVEKVSETEKSQPPEKTKTEE
jgi:putative FmdB family regulatory protein